MQPAHADLTQAEHKVGFLAAEAGLREPLPALPAWALPLTERRAAGLGSVRRLASVPGLARSGNRHHAGCGPAPFPSDSWGVWFSLCCQWLTEGANKKSLGCFTVLKV